MIFACIIASVCRVFIGYILVLARYRRWRIWGKRAILRMVSLHRLLLVLRSEKGGMCLMNYLEHSVKITKCLRVSDSLEPSGSCRLSGNLCFRELWLEKSESFGSWLYLNVFLLKLPKHISLSGIRSCELLYFGFSGTCLIFLWVAQTEFQRGARIDEIIPVKTVCSLCGLWLSRDS